MERLKTVFIIALIGVTSFLVYKTGYFRTPTSAVPTPAPQYVKFAPAAFPVAMAVMTDLGRFGAIYDGDKLNSLWSISSNAIGESLGTADELRQISESEFQAALSVRSLYLDYGFEIPAEVLLRWLNIGSVKSELPSIRRICLVFEENAIVLYFSDGEHFYKAKTETQFAFSEIEEFPPNGSYFAFEAPSVILAPYTLLLDTAPVLSPKIASNPLYVSISAADILSACGMSRYPQGHYRENSTTTVYVEESVRLSLSDNGELSLEDERAREYSDTSLSYAIEHARELLLAISPNSSLYLTKITQISETECQLEFEYFINGIEVILSKSAANVSVSNGKITYMRVQLRQYESAPLYVQPLLLPPKQAAAISHSLGKSTLQAAYIDIGSDSVRVDWVYSR